MEIYTIGFTQRSAESFFETLRTNTIKRLVDVRLNNSSQLAAFAKKADLPYFLRTICGADYVHEPLLAPTEEILKNFKRDKSSSWQEYEQAFLELLKERRVETVIARGLFAEKSVLLCSEASPEKCHRRLVAEYLKSEWKDVDVIHL
jgi:uncharacterized protein (DUF488 family)